MTASFSLLAGHIYHVSDIYHERNPCSGSTVCLLGAQKEERER